MSTFHHGLLSNNVSVSRPVITSRTYFARSCDLICCMGPTSYFSLYEKTRKIRVDKSPQGGLLY
jgi:hypothetical protein